MEVFKILNKSKYLFRYIEEYICVNIPKVYKNYRDGLMDNVVKLNYYIIKAKLMRVILGISIRKRFWYALV